MIAHLHAFDNVALTFPGGWTIIQELNNGSGRRSTAAWKVSTGSEGAFTVTHTAGGDIMGRVFTLTGTHQSAPISASSARAVATSTTVTTTDITPSVDNCMILFLVGTSIATSLSTYTGGDPASYTEQYDSVVSSKTMALGTALQTTAALTNGAQCIGANSTTWVSILVAIAPPAVGGGAAVPVFDHHYRMMRSA